MGIKMKRKIRTSLKGMKVPLTIEFLASELLELGDEAEAQGRSSADFARTLIRLAWEALRGRELGARYDLCPTSQPPSASHYQMVADLRAAIRREDNSYGYRPQDRPENLPQEEAVEESGPGGGSKEEP